mgnify:CR=1 FL=1
MSTSGPEKLVKAIRRTTRRKYSAEEKIRNCPARPSRRRQYCRVMPPGRIEPGCLLSLADRSWIDSSAGLSEFCYVTIRNQPGDGRCR